MPTLLIAVLAVALTLWLIKSFTRSDPRYLVMILTTIGRTVGGILAVAAAAFLLFRGELLISVPLGLFGLSLLGWQPGRELRRIDEDRHDDPAGAAACPSHQREMAGVQRAHGRHQRQGVAGIAEFADGSVKGLHCVYDLGAAGHGVLCVSGWGAEPNKARRAVPMDLIRRRMTGQRASPLRSTWVAAILGARVVADGAEKQSCRRC